MRVLSLFWCLVVLAACSGKEGRDGPNAGETSVATSGASSAAGAGGRASSGGAATGNGVSGKTGTAGASASGGRPGSGGSGSGGSGNGGLNGSANTPSGEVVFGSLVASGDMAQTTFAYARFYPSVRRSSSECESLEYERCTFWSCVPNTIDAAGGPDDAGAITILSEEKQFSVTLFADSNGHYERNSSTLFSFGGEEHVTISALGDEVPPFRVERDVPLVLLLTQPELPASGDLIDVSRNTDLGLRWDRGKPDVFLTLQSSDSIYPRVVCAIPSELGSWTVPAGLLERLSEGNLLALYTIADTSITAGDYTVHARAVGGVMNTERTRRVSIRLE